MTAQADTGDRKVAALVVTYHPDTSFAERFGSLTQQISRVVIVDNGSGAHQTTLKDRYGADPRITIVANDSNLGIAAALNQGMRILCEEGFEWILTLDQDSTVASDFQINLLAFIDGKCRANDVALVGANRLDPTDRSVRQRWLRPGRLWPLFSRVPCDRIDRAGVTLVITSGTAVNATAFNRIGAFNEEYFIDLVDFEYCLRVKKAGYRILVCCDATIQHRPGSNRSHAGTACLLSPMHHEPSRKYYMFRNAIRTMRTYGLAFPHWLLYQILALCEILAGIALREDRKLAKLKACTLGAWDGLCGRSGPTARSF